MSWAVDMVAGIMQDRIRASPRDEFGIIFYSTVCAVEIHKSLTNSDCTVCEGCRVCAGSLQEDAVYAVLTSSGSHRSLLPPMGYFASQHVIRPMLSLNNTPCLPCLAVAVSSYAGW
jgi:hypothetical protein